MLQRDLKTLIMRQIVAYKLNAYLERAALNLRTESCSGFVCLVLLE